jgi:5'-nucleotidase
MYSRKNTQNKTNVIPLQGLGVLFILFLSISVFAGQKVRLVILHTNDTHSQIEPTEKSSLKTSEMGGYARRMGVINQIRANEKNVILVDAGDFSQGTPYFNFYNGRLEVDAMNRMNYDAVTLGNHEFDNGIDTLSVVLANAKFPIISSNYDVLQTPLSKEVKPYLILNRSGLKIGIMALDVNLKGLAFEKNYTGLTFYDPLEKAQEISNLLKKKEKCDVILCLSHLGAETDFKIAPKTHYIDVIIGGHSHSLITKTDVKNADNKDIVIAQMAKSGFYLGEIMLDLEKK